MRTVLPDVLRRLHLGDGQGIVEYGLILSLSALLAVVLLVFFGGTLSAVLQAVGDAIDAATGS
jgi:Flp pilus assembly pilin Flp